MSSLVITLFSMWRFTIYITLYALGSEKENHKINSYSSLEVSDQIRFKLAYSVIKFWIKKLLIYF